jgi:hypothetical protein
LPSLILRGQFLQPEYVFRYHHELKQPQVPEEVQNLKDYVNTYNIVAHAIQTKAIKPVIDLTASYFQIDPTMLKRTLKDAVSNNLLERTKDNTYILKDS